MRLWESSKNNRRQKTSSLLTVKKEGCTLKQHHFLSAHGGGYTELKIDFEDVVDTGHVVSEYPEETHVNAGEIVQTPH